MSLLQSMTVQNPRQKTEPQNLQLPDSLLQQNPKPTKTQIDFGPFNLCTPFVCSWLQDGARLDDGEGVQTIVVDGNPAPCFAMACTHSQISAQSQIAKVKMDRLGPLVINTDGSIARQPPINSVEFPNQFISSQRHQQLARDDRARADKHAASPWQKEQDEATNLRKFTFDVAWTALAPCKTSVTTGLRSCSKSCTRVQVQRAMQTPSPIARRPIDLQQRRCYIGQLQVLTCTVTAAWHGRGLLGSWVACQNCIGCPKDRAI